MLRLIDTHCHLDFVAYEEDLEEVLNRSRDFGVYRVINPAIDLESSEKIISLAASYDMVFAAVGIHPNSATIWESTSLQKIRALAKHPKVVAVGEIGLDYYRDYAPRDLQKEIFIEQLALAAELGLPVIIHNRDATEDLLSILKEYIQHLKIKLPALSTRPGVLHSFSGDTNAALEAVDLNFFIGITGPITFKNAVELQRVVARISSDKLLVETDSPFLTPHPNRGKRNEPGFVHYVAEKIAELKSMTLDQIASITTNNAEYLFGWSE